MASASSVQSHYEQWLSSARDLLAANDFAGAKRLAEQAMQSKPLHPDRLVDRILAVADVLLAAPDDPRSVLQLNPSPSPSSSATMEVVSSYRRLSLLLRNADDLPSAPRARDLVSWAYSALPKQQEPPVLVVDGGAFWTLCPACCHAHQYAAEHVGKELRCPMCAKGFRAVEMASPPEVVEGTGMYRCAWGFFPVGPALAAEDKGGVPPPPPPPHQRSPAEEERRRRAKPTARKSFHGCKRKILGAVDYGDDDYEEEVDSDGQGG